MASRGFYLTVTGALGTITGSGTSRPANIVFRQRSRIPAGVVTDKVKGCTAFLLHVFQFAQALEFAHS